MNIDISRGSVNDVQDILTLPMLPARAEIELEGERMILPDDVALITGPDSED